MGPRLFSRGNADFEISSYGICEVLQWGHDFSAVEILPFFGNKR